MGRVNLVVPPPPPQMRPNIADEPVRPFGLQNSRLLGVPDADGVDEEHRSNSEFTLTHFSDTSMETAVRGADVSNNWMAAYYGAEADGLTTAAPHEDPYVQQYFRDKNNGNDGVEVLAGDHATNRGFDDHYKALGDDAT